MSRILVVHYSRTGHTDFVATQIAARCDADIEHIEEPISRKGVLGYLRSAFDTLLGLRPAIQPGRHQPEDYDLVIVGTPVWFWSVSSPVRSWVHRHQAALRNVAVFCTCGGSGQTHVLDELERLCGHPALARLALTERAAMHCQQDPAFQSFLQDLQQARSGAVPIHSLQNPSAA